MKVTIRYMVLTAETRRRRVFKEKLIRCHLDRRERSPEIQEIYYGLLPFALRASLRLFKSLLAI